jgi:hypothetical protein
MERIESKGGSLDDPISDESDETKGDLCDDGSDPIDEKVASSDWLEQALGKHPKMKGILEKEGKGEPLTDAERQYKKRFIDKHKEQQ